MASSSKTDTEVIIGGKVFTLSGYESDDYFKAKKQISALEEDLAAKDKELYDLRHELISTQIKLEGVEEQVKALQKAQNEGEKEIVRLETELKKK